MRHPQPLLPLPTTPEPACTAAEREAFDYIINLVYEHSRIRLHDGKHALIRARLGKRMRKLGVSSLSDYCAILQQPGSDDELTQAIDALTTNFTNFLRESDHFDFLVKQALPPLLKSGPRRFRVWSAACATGEEPYSIAFYLHEHFPVASGWDWSVLATDISTKALGKAKQAVYSGDRLQAVPLEWQRRYFRQGHGDWEGHYQVKSGVRDRVQFSQLNLLGAYHFAEKFEVIFCRNVMIYFDRPTQEQLVRQLLNHLVPRGYLLIGHSESLTGLPLPIRCLKPSVYQRD